MGVTLRGLPSLDLARYAYTSFRLCTAWSHGTHEDLAMSCHQMAEGRTERQDLLVVTKSFSPRMTVSSPMGHESLMSVQFSQNMREITNAVTEVSTISFLAGCFRNEPKGCLEPLPT